MNDYRFRKTARSSSLLSAALLCLISSSTSALSQDNIFDEARFGVLTSVDGGHHEDGVFLTGMVFFDPFDHRDARGWDKLARPRIHIGADVSTAGATDQVYAGFSWTANLTDRLFFETGFGGTLHDGNLDHRNDNGPRLGCRALFHEYAALGINMAANLTATAQIEHASHANLCDGPNEGLTRAGLLVGYRF
jgi:lipid A 3-O-deacylase